MLMVSRQLLRITKLQLVVGQESINLLSYIRTPCSRQDALTLIEGSLSKKPNTSQNGLVGELRVLRQELSEVHIKWLRAKWNPWNDFRDKLQDISNKFRGYTQA